MYARDGRCYFIGIEVIYKERESVLHHGIKTPRSVLKNEVIGRVFFNNFEVS